MKRLKSIYRYFGIKGIFSKIYNKYFNTYERFLRKEEIPTKEEMSKTIATFNYTPLLSIITPIFQPKLTELKEYFDSLLTNNSYQNIELCLVDDGSNMQELDELIKKYQTLFPNKIKYQKNIQNKGIAYTSNKALELAEGEYLILVDQDDMIASHALFEYLKVLQENKYDFLYSDEDMITTEGKRFNPYFKPSWSPHTLLSRMYVNHLSMYKKSIVDKVGGFREAYEGCQDYDLLLRAAKYFVNVYHCPKILYHWRTSENSIATSIENKKYLITRAENSIMSYFESLGIKSAVKQEKDLLIYDIDFEDVQTEVYSIVFTIDETSNENITSFETLCDNLIKGNKYDIYIVGQVFEEDYLERVEKNCSCYFLKDEKSLFLKLAKNVDEISEHIFFLKGNILLKNNSLLAKLAKLAVLEDIGIIAPTILNKLNVILEAGRIIGNNKQILYANYGFSYASNNYFGSNISLVNYSLVSSECFLIKKAILFNNSKMTASFSCIDDELGLKSLDDGYYNVNAGNLFAINTNVKHRPFYSTSSIEGKTDLFYNSNFSLNYLNLYKWKDSFFR